MSDKNDRSIESLILNLPVREASPELDSAVLQLVAKHASRAARSSRQSWAILAAVAAGFALVGFGIGRIAPRGPAANEPVAAHQREGRAMRRQLETPLAVRASSTAPLVGSAPTLVVDQFLLGVDRRPTRVYRITGGKSRQLPPLLKLRQRVAIDSRPI
ncbi:MAG: hypothetical protein AAF961_01455 [Planctomycetota bacterium]